MSAVPRDLRLSWPQMQTIQSVAYTCGYCGNQVASDRGWSGTQDGEQRAYVCVCHRCSGPTFIGLGYQVPSTVPGAPVASIADDGVEKLYAEARRCIGANAFTAAVLACRKLLMHIAVEKKATPGGSFVSYVDHLATLGYIPPDSREWVDHIRRKSNEANHEIVLMSREDAIELLGFSEMLLKLIYEYPTAMKARAEATAAASTPNLLV